MGGSLEFVIYPVCEYGSACADYTLEEEPPRVYCSVCSYDSIKDGPAFVFLYRKEFRIAVLAKDLEEAYVKAQTGCWVNVTLATYNLHYDLLEWEENNV